MREDPQVQKERYETKVKKTIMILRVGMKKIHGNLGSTLERQQSWEKNCMCHKIHLFVLLELMEPKSLNQPNPLFLA